MMHRNKIHTRKHYFAVCYHVKYPVFEVCSV